jgi:small conductance mechanosensitive channel
VIAVCRSLITVFVWFVATVAIFSEIGIALGPLFATAGILGVALGFGTQTMVRDFIAGFFIVVEDQFGVGDVVDLGRDAKGTVEQVTLRSTRVRDAAGVVWHIGNGQILRVGNKSQEWSRALIDVVVGYHADIPTVRRVMGEVANALAADPDWSDDVLEAPDVWGIEDLTTEGVVVRMVVKTRPAAQFALLREMRERLITSLAAAGISFAAAAAPAEVVLRDARVEPTSEPPAGP